MIESVLHDLDVEVYIDDIGIFSNSYKRTFEFKKYCSTTPSSSWNESQPIEMRMVCPRNRLPWVLADTNWNKTLTEKVEADLKMDRPQTITQLRSFLGGISK